jgi:hypothetical protein
LLGIILLGRAIDIERVRRHGRPSGE